MNDIQIIRLYQIRDEKAIEESDKKYGSYCFAVANNILSSREDSEGMRQRHLAQKLAHHSPEMPRRSENVLCKDNTKPCY